MKRRRKFTARIIYRAEDVLISTDRYGYCVSKPGVMCRGTERLHVEAEYYPHVEDACAAAVRRIADQSNAASVAEYADTLERAITEFKNWVKAHEDRFLPGGPMAKAS